MRTVPVLALALALALPAPAAGKDLMLRQRAFGPGGPAGGEEQSEYFSGDRIVIASPTRRAIVDLKAQTWTLIDPKRKTYSVMTFDELRRLAERAAKALDALPPEARQKLALDTPLSVRPTGKSERIAGYAAKEYEVSGGTASGSVWLTDEITMPAEVREWEKVSSSLGVAQGAGAGLAAAIARLNGVPLRTKMTVALGPRKVESGTEVLEVREATPPADLLTVPAGFKKGALPGLGE
jgi:hypothetical protein